VRENTSHTTEKFDYSACRKISTKERSLSIREIYGSKLEQSGIMNNHMCRIYRINESFK
jgi:hypothetical protein